jgi:hypothetical protein
MGLEGMMSESLFFSFFFSPSFVEGANIVGVDMDTCFRTFETGLSTSPKVVREKSTGCLAGFLGLCRRTETSRNK